MPPGRAGKFVEQPGGYRAFIPAPPPPLSTPLEMGEEMVCLLSDADRSLGRLDGAATTLPNPDLFVAMYVRLEAVLSSQIEGTKSTLEDLLRYEAGAAAAREPKDVEEAVNYVRAMNHGLRRLGELPVCLRLIREIHAELLSGVRGSERMPGEFRRSQNYIGPVGATLQTAGFVPPPVLQMHEALNDLEKFLHESRSLPPLIHCALAHAQFETIHPFLDGNGRLGRLLITFLLCQQEVLHRPLLYLSYYLRMHRAEYYDRLNAVRYQGDWEGWVKFFLRAVDGASRSATETACKILSLRAQHRAEVAESGGNTALAIRLLEMLFEQPIVTVRNVEEKLGCSYATASRLLAALERLKLVQEISGRQRGRIYVYGPYLDLFPRSTPEGE